MALFIKEHVMCVSLPKCFLRITILYSIPPLVTPFVIKVWWIWRVFENYYLAALYLGGGNPNPIHST